MDLESLLHIDRDALWKSVSAREIDLSVASNRPLDDIFNSFFYPVDPNIRSPHLRGLLNAREDLLAALNKKVRPAKSLRILELPLDRMPTAEEIKSSYLRLVKQFHPDLNPGSAEAVEKFKQIQTAYEEISGLHQQIDQFVAQQEAKIRAHFHLHRESNGWINGISDTGVAAASFPVDHLAAEQREALAKALEAEGYHVRQHFSEALNSNVVSITSSANEPVSAKEVAQKLKARFQPAAAATATNVEHAIPPAKVGVAAGSAEANAAQTLKDAAKSAEEAAAKAGGKAKWIVGGIIAATVAVGAFIAYRRKTAVAREQDRRQNNTADRSIG